MRSYLVYVCTFCEKKSSRRDEIELCEATCLGLTLDDKRRYDELLEKARRSTSALGNRQNPQLLAEQDKAYDELLAFEQEKGITKKG